VLEVESWVEPVPQEGEQRPLIGVRPGGHYAESTKEKGTSIREDR
jgi:hypothetical protein